MVPPAYRSLLLTYPRSWRREHGDIILDTLLSVHAETGRGTPRLSERIRFAIDGIRVRIIRRLRGLPPRRFADVTALQSFHRFDQGNGMVPHDREVGELEQLRANSPADRNSDVDRATAIAYSGMGMIR